VKPVAAAMVLFTASCTCHGHAPPPQYEYYDPMTVDASTVDDLHHHRIRAVCKVGPQRPETILQLCRDKGFDGVTFDTVTVALLKQAERLGLTVITAPSGSAGSRTTNGS